MDLHCRIDLGQMEARSFRRSRLGMGTFGREKKIICFFYEYRDNYIIIIIDVMQLYGR